MANEKNLVPMNKRTKNEQREIAKKGGIASGKARREKRTLREIMEIYGDMPNPDCEGQTNDEAIVIAQYKLARSKGPGSTQAAAFIRDTKGEKPHDVIETPDIEIKPLIDLTKRKKNGEGKQ